MSQLTPLSWSTLSQFLSVSVQEALPHHQGSLSLPCHWRLSWEKVLSRGQCWSFPDSDTFGHFRGFTDEERLDHCRGLLTGRDSVEGTMTGRYSAPLGSDSLVVSSWVHSFFKVCEINWSRVKNIVKRNLIPSTSTFPHSCWQWVSWLPWLPKESPPYLDIHLTHSYSVTYCS